MLYKTQWMEDDRHQRQSTGWATEDVLQDQPIGTQNETLQLSKAAQLCRAGAEGARGGKGHPCVPWSLATRSQLYPSGSIKLS